MATAHVHSPGAGDTPAVERRILLIEDSAVLTRRLVDLLSEPGRVAVAFYSYIGDQPRFKEWLHRRRCQRRYVDV